MKRTAIALALTTALLTPAGCGPSIPSGTADLSKPAPYEPPAEGFQPKTPAK